MLPGKGDWWFERPKRGNVLRWEGKRFESLKVPKVPKVATRGTKGTGLRECSREPRLWEEPRKTTVSSPGGVALLAGRQVPSTKALGGAAVDHASA